MLNIERKVKTITGCTPDAIPESVLTSDEPIILKNLVSNWPIVQAGIKSDFEASNYLRQFYQGEDVVAFLGEPEIDGRIFYNEDMTGFNYQSVKTKLDFALDKFLEYRDEVRPPTIYIGSTVLNNYLPGFRKENDLTLEQYRPLASIWISNKCRIAAHWDSPKNIACSVVGHRKFTLFPPHQLKNLYVGPLDKTPAGQAISLVDFYNPDFEKFPKFKDALKYAQIADLEPGDALYLPGMWWHHVESLGKLNILVNYWLRESPNYFGAPIDVLSHAILSIRDLPDNEKKIWKELFDHYIFNYDQNDFEHIPVTVRGSIGALDSDVARKIRALLLNKLNR